MGSLCAARSVRIALDHAPDDVRLIAGRTATVSIDSRAEFPQPLALKVCGENDGRAPRSANMVQAE